MAQGHMAEEGMYTIVRISHDGWNVGEDHQEDMTGTSSGGPAAKMPHSQCRGPRLNLWSRN